MTSWWQKELQRFAEQSAVALGLMSEEEAKADEQLTLQELNRRFMAEACAIKDPRKQIGPLGIPSCSNVQVDDGRNRCGPQATIEDIGVTMESWKSRLESKDCPDALDALLQSRALDVVLKALPNSKAGRTAVQDAAEGGAQSDGASPMRVVLFHAAAVPDALLGQILLLFSDSAKIAEQGRQAGKDVSVADRGLHWVSAILSAALLDAGEAALKKRGQIVEVVQYAVSELHKSAFAQRPVMTCDQKLDATQALTSNFGELKGVCEQLKNAQQPVGADVGKILNALADSLAALRAENEVSIEAIEPASVQAVFVQAGVTTREIEANLERRCEKATKLSSVLATLPKHQPDIAAVCLEVERLRGHRLQDALDDLQRDLWGDQAFEHDEAMLAELRARATRAEQLVTEAWRERMHYAAETLDDTASTTALVYKEMRQTLLKSIARLVVLEKSKTEGSTNSSSNQTTKLIASRSVASIDQATLASIASLRSILQLEPDPAPDVSPAAAQAPAPEAGAPLKVAAAETQASPAEAPESPAAVKLRSAGAVESKEGSDGFESASPAMKLSEESAAMKAATAVTPTSKEVAPTSKEVTPTSKEVTPTSKDVSSPSLKLAQLNTGALVLSYGPAKIDARKCPPSYWEGFHERFYPSKEEATSIASPVKDASSSVASAAAATPAGDVQPSGKAGKLALSYSSSGDLKLAYDTPASGRTNKLSLSYSSDGHLKLAS